MLSCKFIIVLSCKHFGKQVHGCQPLIDQCAGAGAGKVGTEPSCCGDFTEPCDLDHAEASCSESFKLPEGRSAASCLCVDGLACTVKLTAKSCCQNAPKIAAAESLIPARPPPLGKKYPSQPLADAEGSYTSSEDACIKGPGATPKWLSGWVSDQCLQHLYVLFVGGKFGGFMQSHSLL